MVAKNKALCILLLVLGAGLALGTLACGKANPNQAADNLTELGRGSASGCPGCVLRDAIVSAQAGDTITIPAGVYSLPFGELVLDKNLTLEGAGPGKTILEAASTPGVATNRVLRVAFGATAMVTGVTLRHGVENSREERMVIFPVLPGGIVTINQEFGGGVYNHGTLHLENVVITGNHSGSGAGIFNGGTMTLTSCNISSNNADGMGGGIFNGGYLTVTDCVISRNKANTGAGLNNWADITIDRSTLSGNLSRVNGGGILNTSVGYVEINSSTLDGNQANFGGAIRNEGEIIITNSTASDNIATYGGGIDNWGDLKLTNTTISGNQAQSSGGGIHISKASDVATAELANTILASNTSSEGPDCKGDFDSFGNNLVGDTSDCGFKPGLGDILGNGAQPVEPGLGQLQDNGGPTNTQELLTGSPAIDAGGQIPDLSTDQRGNQRPDEEPWDIGAFEK